MKRLAIFIHYDKHNIVAPFVELYIRALTTVSTEICFVSNSAIPENEQQKVRRLGAKVIIRQNQGMDFGAWKDIIFSMGFDRLSQYDELILCNDSCFAPMFPLNEMFHAMAHRICHFWGVTEHQAGETGSGNLPTHLQSYFLVFRKDVIHSDSFRLFWADIDPLRQNYDTIIRDMEAQLTARLNRAGFIHEVYIAESDLFPSTHKGAWHHSRFFNRTIWNWCGLLQHRNPFLKRKSIPFHLERSDKLIRIGYGSEVTSTVYKQTFYWKNCIHQSKSDYAFDVISKQIQRDTGFRPDAILPNRRLQLLKFYLWLPYRSFKKMRHAARKKVR